MGGRPHPGPLATAHHAAGLQIAEVAIFTVALHIISRLRDPPANAQLIPIDAYLPLSKFECAKEMRCARNHFQY
jgi:hypothetical protein